MRNPQKNTDPTDITSSMMNIPYNIQMSTGVPNVPEQSRVFQQPRMVTQQMQTAPCIYSTNPQGIRVNKSY